MLGVRFGMSGVQLETGRVAKNRYEEKVIFAVCPVHSPFTPVSLILRLDIVTLTIGGQLAPARR
jgi:hypothetical protein